MDDIESLNLVNQYTRVEPNYKLSGRETSIEIFLNDKDDIIIVGVVDSNYIYWASLTKTYDKEKNEKIFNHIAKGNFKEVSNLHLILKSIKFSYLILKSIKLSYEDVIKNWYQDRLIRVKEDGRIWKIPFREGEHYSADQVEKNGYYFAASIASFLKDLQEKCKFREADGTYESVLDYCLNILNQDSQDEYYYRKVEPLIHIMEKEKYLLVSKNHKIKKKYIQIMERCSYLYGRYMTAVR